MKIEEFYVLFFSFFEDNIDQVKKIKINKLKLLELSKVFLNYFLDQIESC